MTLRRAQILLASDDRRLAIVDSTPSRRVRIAEELLVGLEVDIGGAVLDRIEQDLVDETDDRRVLDVVALDVVAFLARRR